MTPYLYKLGFVQTEVYQIYRPTNSQYEVTPCKTACTALLISGSWKAIVILQKSVSSFDNYYTLVKITNVLVLPVLPRFSAWRRLPAIELMFAGVNIFLTQPIPMPGSFLT